MTLHVNIGDAKTQLSRLIAAARRGERIIIDRDGEPQVELIPVTPDRDKDARRARLKAFAGSLRDQIGQVDWFASDFTDAELESLEQPKF